MSDPDPTFGERVNAAARRFGKAMELVREVVAMDPETFDSWENAQCAFCNGRETYDVPPALRHTADCFWVRCNDLVKEMDG